LHVSSGIHKAVEPVSIMSLKGYLDEPKYSSVS